MIFLIIIIIIIIIIIVVVINLISASAIMHGHHHYHHTHHNALAVLIIATGILLSSSLLIIFTYHHHPHYQSSLSSSTTHSVIHLTRMLSPSLPSSTHTHIQSAIFDFSSLITVILLFIVTCTYLRSFRATIFDNAPQPDGSINRHEGILGFCWKASRIGERKSEYVGLACVIMAVHVLFFKKP